LYVVIFIAVSYFGPPSNPVKKDLPKASTTEEKSSKWVEVGEQGKLFTGNDMCAVAMDEEALAESVNTALAKDVIKMRDKLLFP